MASLEARAGCRATCAICMSGIAPGTRFLIIGTEIAHRDCAATGEPTQTAKQKCKLADLAAELAGVSRKLLQARSDADAAGRSSANHWQQHLESQRLLRIARDSVLQSQREARDLQAAYAAVVSERDQLRRAIDEVTGVSAAPAAAVAVEAKATPDEDDSRIRFSLLELDPL